MMGKGVHFKYLDKADRNFILGMHTALDAIYDMLGGVDDLEDTDISEDDVPLFEMTEQYILDKVGESDDSGRADILKAYDVVGQDVASVAACSIIEAIRDAITLNVSACSDNIEDFDAREKEVDDTYDALEITPDMTLFDEEGYLYGVVCAKSDDKWQIVTADGKEEPTLMTEDEIKSYYIQMPFPICTEYKDGKKIEHYRYGENKVSSFGSDDADEGDIEPDDSDESKVIDIESDDNSDEE